MAVPYSASMPPGLDVSDGYTIRLTAVDPTTGAVVSGVKVQSLNIQVLNLGGGTIPEGGGFTVTPLLQYTPGVT